MVLEGLRTLSASDTKAPAYDHAASAQHQEVTNEWNTVCHKGSCWADSGDEGMQWAIAACTDDSFFCGRECPCRDGSALVLLDTIL
jgi:hypothetical protein